MIAIAGDTWDISYEITTFPNDGKWKYYTISPEKNRKRARYFRRYDRKKKALKGKK